MRLIDADLLSEAIHENVSALYEDAVCAKKDCLTEVYEAPTVDAVPVVRCRECKHRKYDDIFGMLWCYLDSCTKRVKPDDFCSHGERKEGADNG